MRPRIHIRGLPVRGTAAALVLCVAILAGSVKDARAQEFITNVSNKGTVAASFLEIGIGARATALGGSYAAERARPEMIYWNPAGLAYAEGLAVSFTHAEWLADTNFEFFAVATPVPLIRSVVAASITALTVPAQPVRTVMEPEGTGESYSAQDYAVNLSVSAKLIPSFSVGVSGKYISQRIWSESAAQVAVDVGVYYQTPLAGLALGASISNFGPDMRIGGKNLTNIIDPDLTNRGIENIPVEYKTDAFPLPQIFRFGMAYSTPVPGRGSLSTLVSLMHPTGSTESVSFGIEYGFSQLIFFRAGYQNLFERDAVNGLTLGGGLQYILRSRNTVSFDYAYSDWSMLMSVHRVSLTLAFR